VIPEAAVEAAARAMAPAVWGPSVWQFAAHGEAPADARDRVQQQALKDARAALEAAAPHMVGYKWPVGDDDNPHRDGDVQPSRHWLVNSDTGWECSGCDWTGAILKDYWTEHEKLDEYKVPF